MRCGHSTCLKSGGQVSFEILFILNTSFPGSCVVSTPMQALQKALLAASDLTSPKPVNRW